MRELHELINDAEYGLARIEGWANNSAKPVEILPANRTAGATTLLALQITTGSILGALAFRTGGVLIDHGWLRHLGSGHPHLGGGLLEWNASLGGDPLDPPLEDALVVAYDIMGGFFAINAGAWKEPSGSMRYWAPDRGGWEPIDLGHGEFVAWSIGGGPDQFYEEWRWLGWETEVAALGPDEGISVYPPLGLRDPKEVELAMTTRHRSPAPMRELWLFYHDLHRQLGSIPDGGEVRFDTED